MKFFIFLFLVVMGKKGRNKKDIIPLELVQYHHRNSSPSPARDSSTWRWRAALHASKALLAAINSSLSDD